MAKLTFEQQIKRMTPEQVEANRTEIENYRDKVISEISASSNWSLQAQDGHRCAFILKAVRIEEKLNGKESANKLRKELYSKGFCYRKLTPEEKAAKYAYSCVSSLSAEDDCRCRVSVKARKFGYHGRGRLDAFKDINANVKE